MSHLPETDDIKQSINDQNNNNNSNQPKSKTKAAVLYLQCSKTFVKKKNITAFNKKYFETFRPDVNVNDWNFDDYKGKVIGYAIVTHNTEAKNLQKYIDDDTSTWLKQYIPKQKLTQYGWKLEHVHQLTKFIKYTGRQGAFDIIDQDKLKELKENSPKLDEYLKQYNIYDHTWKMCSVRHRWLQLIMSGKKKYEYRSARLCNDDLKFLNNKQIAQSFGINIDAKNAVTVDGQIGYSKSCVPSRKAMPIKKRPTVDLMAHVINKKKWMAGYFVQNRMDWDEEEIMCETSWYYHKSNDKKNLNKGVIEHNKEISRMLRSMIKATDYWRGILDDRSMSFLLNFVDVICTRPQDYQKMLIALKNELGGNRRLRAPIAYCLHLIRPGRCYKKTERGKKTIICSGFRDYKHVAATTTKKCSDLWVCTVCGKKESVWNRSFVSKFNNKWKIEGILCGMFGLASLLMHKNDSVNTGVSLRGVGRLRAEIKETMTIYLSQNPIKVGGLIEGRPTRACHDHSEFSKLKYNQGYKKSHNTKIMGSSDEHGLIRMDIAANERRAQTEYLLTHQSWDNTFSTTDQASVFNNIPQLGENRTHQSVSHSGQIDKITGLIHYFVCMATGIDNNGIEGWFGKFKQYCRAHPTMMSSKTAFKDGMNDFEQRHNLAANIAPQVFLNYLLAILTVHPSNGDGLVLKALQEFENCFDVEFIIKDRKNPLRENREEFFVKWKGFGHRDNTWVAFDNFHDVAFIENYRRITAQEKKIRQKKYDQAIAREKKNATKCNNIAGLSISKIKNLCDITKNTFIVGRKMQKENYVVRRRPLKKGQKNLTGIIASGSDDAVVYNASAFTDVDGSVTSWGCGCLYQQFNEQFICKHVVCLLVDRCCNKST